MNNIHLHYYFRKYNGEHWNCLYTGGRSLPPPGARTMVEVNLQRTFSSEEGSGHQRQCYNCEKRTKRKEEKLYSYKLLTSLIQPYNLFYFY